MSHQYALWVGEEMSSDSDICSVFMGVSEKRRRGKGRKRDEVGEER